MVVLDRKERRLLVVLEIEEATLACVGVVGVGGCYCRMIMGGGSRRMVD